MSFHTRPITSCTYIQPSNSEKLCSSVIHVAQSFLPSLSQEATAVYDKFKPVLSLFAKCHFIYNQKFVSEEKAKELGTLYVYSVRAHTYTHTHTHTFTKYIFFYLQRHQLLALWMCFDGPSHLLLFHQKCICSKICLLYTSPSPRDATLSRMPSSA